jgi:hypothetical protein
VIQKTLVAALLGILIILMGCSSSDTSTPDDTAIIQPAALEGWRTNTLTDVVTGEPFKVADFDGQTILIESFAVWCPTCTAQQRQSKILKEQSDEVVHISLDTDPNEDEQIVKDHVTQNGFDWLYAISPAENTKSLINEFGIGIVNAPSVPMVLICPDGQTFLLDRGLKLADKLTEEINTKCNG